MTIPFDRVVREHGPTVLRVCRAAVGTQAADDVWSETFLAALRAYPGLPGDANVEAWLVTIARRKAVDHHRAAERAVPVADTPEAAVPDVDHPLRLDVERAVAALPPRQRLAVTMHHLAGWPWPVVADAVGCSPAAARRAGSDGIAALRRSGHLTPVPEGA